MTWADFYLVCFVVGFVLSIVMFIAGGVRFPHMHIHLPGLHGHGFHGHVAGAHAPANPHPGSGGDISPFNLITLTAFLAWFGGTGYLLARHSTMWFFSALIVSVFAGIGGAAIIYLFLSRVLSSPEEALDPADFEMVGVLGKLSVRISDGGTGELIYSQAGTRRVCGARSDDGLPILKGTEVVVTRYERGIAYVRRWSEMAGENLDVADTASAQDSKEARPQ
jgi:membrane protein implicated in regulation of membrane protease activity